MRKLCALLCLGVVLVGCSAKPIAEGAEAGGTASAPAPEIRTEEDRTVYALGVGLSRQLTPFHLTPAEIEMLEAGLADGALGRPAKVDVEAYRDKIALLADERGSAAAADQKKAGAAFAEKAAAESGARKLATGVVLQIRQQGSGNTPMLGDSVQVRYKGSLVDGTVFDSTDGEKEAATLPMGSVIPCWQQALQLLKEGAKARVVCPSDAAYGDRGLGPTIPPGATLVFELELVSVQR